MLKCKKHLSHTDIKVLTGSLSAISTDNFSKCLFFKGLEVKILTLPDILHPQGTSSARRWGAPSWRGASPAQWLFVALLPVSDPEPVGSASASPPLSHKTPAASGPPGLLNRIDQRAEKKQEICWTKSVKDRWSTLHQLSYVEKYCTLVPDVTSGLTNLLDEWNGHNIESM